MLSVLLWFPAMNKVAITGLGVRYIQSTSEHAPATIVGPSMRGDGFIHLNYTRNMQNFAFTSCSSAMFVRIVLGVGNRQVFYV